MSSWGGDPIIGKRVRRAYEEGMCNTWLRIPVLLNKDPDPWRRLACLREEHRTETGEKRTDYYAACGEEGHALLIA